MTASELLVEGLAAGHGGPLVLDGLDLDVSAGATMAVLGESGSGKSTLLRAVAGLLPTERGRIHVGQRDVTQLAPDERDVGMVFQSLALFPHRNVAANVAFGPRAKGWSRERTERVVNDWLDRVGLGGLGPRDVSTLSGGQRQRVALARALAAEPAVLLLDEPLGALDTGLRGQLLTLLREVFQKAATTAVHVTHDPTEAATLAGTIAVLDQGRIVQTGTPAALWEAPSSAVVARLVGHPNVLPSFGTDRARIVPPSAVGLSVPPPGDPGPHPVVTLVTPGAAWQVVVRLPNGEQLTAVASAASAPRPGDPVTVDIDRSQVLEVLDPRERPIGGEDARPFGADSV